MAVRQAKQRPQFILYTMLCVQELNLILFVLLFWFNINYTHVQNREHCFEFLHCQFVLQFNVSWPSARCTNI